MAMVEKTDASIKWTAANQIVFWTKKKETNGEKESFKMHIKMSIT